MSCARDDIEREVLERLRPTRIQLSLLEQFYSLIERKLVTCDLLDGLDFRVELQGSLAKGTILSDTWEIDVFVLFKNVDRPWVHSEGFKRVSECLKTLPTIRRYAEHPYVTVTISGVEADVVPSLDVEDPLKYKGRLSVERTPLHTRYVRSKLTGCMRDEVRLLKSFFKSIGVYGAESHVGGFSGYVCELLIVHYGSFIDALRAISEWKPGIHIAVGDHEKKASRTSKGESPIVIIDPVDPHRNAAAAITIESLAKAVAASRLYLDKPSKAFFHVFEDIHKRALASLIRKLDEGISVAALDCQGDFYEDPPENVHGRLKRASRVLHSMLLKQGVPSVASSYYWDEADQFALVSILGTLGDGMRVEVVRGPEAWIDRGRFHGFIGKRFSEEALVTVSSEGFLLGIRHARDVGEYIKSRILPQLPLPPRTRKCEVVICSSLKECNVKGLGEVLWRLFRLTPALLKFH